MLKPVGLTLALCLPVLFLSGCQDSPSSQAQSPPPTRPISVDVAVARLESLQAPRQYTGTTAPSQTVTLRARTEGSLVSLNADRGDIIQQGEVVAQQDDALLTANVLQAEAQLAELMAEVSRTQTLVVNAQAQVERARLEHQQAQADADRFQQLSQQGVVATQAAEQTRTRANTALQTLRSAEAQVKSQRAEITSAQRRVEAQRAILQQAQERRSFTVIRAPIGGLVMERISESGSLLQPGNEILTIGNFDPVKVIVEVPELDRGRLRPGQAATVRLDAFPDKELRGQISRISPAADPQSRLVPVEVSIANAQQTIGSGLLARVTFEENNNQVLVTPATAIAPRSNQIFVIQRSENEITVQARPIEVGEKQDGRVVIRSGLAPGEEYVVRSSRPLNNGDRVVVSALSGARNDRN